VKELVAEVSSNTVDIKRLFRKVVMVPSHELVNVAQDPMSARHNVTGRRLPARLDQQDGLRILGLLGASTAFDQHEGAGLCVAWLKGRVERWNRHGERLHSPGTADWNTSGP
jgi:hypothetical protein